MSATKIKIKLGVQPKKIEKGELNTKLASNVSTYL